MFVPQDPRFEEILRLAAWATGPGLPDRDRPRFRELCGQLLGELEAAGRARERRRALRAPSRIRVELLSPRHLAGVVACSVGSGGVGLLLPERLPAGAEVELAIDVEGRAPLRTRGQVVYALPGAETGIAFTDLHQRDRELLEALAVRALLAEAAAQ